MPTLEKINKFFDDTEARINASIEKTKKELAVKTIYFKDYRFTGATLAVWTTIVSILAELGAITAAVVAATAFVGLAVTPVIWIILAAVLAIGLVGYSIYKCIKFIDRLDTVDKLLQERAKIDNANIHMLHEARNKINEVASGKQLSVEAQKILDDLLKIIPEQNDTQLDNIDVKTKQQSGLFAKIKSIFKTLLTLFALISRVREKILEYGSFISSSLAIVGGVLAGAATMLGINIAALGIVASFSVLTGLAGPVGIAFLVILVLSYAIGLAANKYLVVDPLNCYEREVKEGLASFEKDIKFYKTTNVAADALVLVQVREAEVAAAKAAKAEAEARANAAEAEVAAAKAAKAEAEARANAAEAEVAVAKAAKAEAEARVRAAEVRAQAAEANMAQLVDASQLLEPTGSISPVSRSVSPASITADSIELSVGYGESVDGDSPYAVKPPILFSRIHDGSNNSDSDVHSLASVKL